MARKSRSKQRGKGVGSRSQSAGTSKGGSRSSAGKSGGNKSGSGAKGGSKGKSTSSKSSPARSNKGAPSPSSKAAPAKKKPTLTGPGMGPRGKLSSPQSIANRARFKAREAAGLSGLTGGPKGESVSQYRARQRQQVQDAARIRNNKFKAEQAAKQKAAQEKQARQFAPSRLYAGTEYDNYVASLPEGVRNDMMIGGQTRSPLSEAAIAAGTIFGGKALIGGGLSALGIGGSKGLGFKGVQAGFTGMGKTGFDAIRGGAKYIASKKPQILGRGAYSAPTFKGAQRYAGTTGSLGGTQTPGGVIKSIVPGKASRIGFIESQAKVPGATFDKGVQLANKLSAGNYGTSALANRLRTQMVSGVAPGGGIGSNLGNIAKQTGIATAVAGGLNIGSSGSEDSGEASDKPSGIARVIAGGADKIMRDTTDFDRRGKEKNFLADAFTQTNTALKTIKPYFDAAKGQDDKSIRKQASNLLTDIGAREELAPVARGIKAFTTDNPNVPNRFGMETLSDIKDTFTPGKPKMPSIDPKSGIVMSIGNRMLAGDLKNIVKEADQQTGVEKGATRTLGQTINVAKQIGKNLGDTSTQGYKSAQKIAKLTGTGSGKPTPGSIIRGVNPFSRSGRGSNRSVPSSRAGGTNPNTLALLPQQQQTPAEQFVVPQIPQQQGLDAGNLANVQNQSYQNTFNNLMAINPNYSARFQMRPRRNIRRGNFRSMFSRDYF